MLACVLHVNMPGTLASEPGLGAFKPRFGSLRRAACYFEGCLSRPSLPAAKVAWFGVERVVGVGLERTTKRGMTEGCFGEERRGRVTR